MDEWEQAANLCVQEREAAEREISQALEKLLTSTVQSKNGTMSDESDSLCQKPQAVEQKASELEELHLDFDAEQKKRFHEQHKKWQKSWMLRLKVLVLKLMT
eukprot:5495715-Ditylum_brightwellii.AAC.2